MDDYEHGTYQIKTIKNGTTPGFPGMENPPQ
jgi:hypothetical protein